MLLYLCVSSEGNERIPQGTVLLYLSLSRRMNWQGTVGELLVVVLVTIWEEEATGRSKQGRKGIMLRFIRLKGLTLLPLTLVI